MVEKRRINISFQRTFRIYRKDILFLDIKSEEIPKNLETCCVPSLGPDISWPSPFKAHGKLSSYFSVCLYRRALEYLVTDKMSFPS